MMTSFKNIDELILVILSIILIMIALIVLIATINLYFSMSNKLRESQGKPSQSLIDIFKKWYSGLTNAVPIEKENTIMLSHNYDGIRELDNHLPPWWTSLFVLCLVFAVVYMGVYHVWDLSPLQETEYANEITTAEKQIAEYQAKNAEKIDENSVKELLTDAKEIDKGKSIYTANCVACHGAALEGGVGPNLTDNFWIHGKGAIGDVFKVIKNGVPEKGMIAWKATLKPDQIQAVSNFILSTKNTNPPNAKAPQGEEVK